MAFIDRPASSGRPGPGEIEHRVRFERSQLGERQRIVTVDDRLGAELAEVLDEVVDERVVVVDDEDPHGVGPYRNRRRPPGSITSATVPQSKSKRHDRDATEAQDATQPSKLWVPTLMFTPHRRRRVRDRRELLRDTAGRAEQLVPADRHRRGDRRLHRRDRRPIARNYTTVVPHSLGKALWTTASPPDLLSETAPGPEFWTSRVGQGGGLERRGRSCPHGSGGARSAPRRRGRRSSSPRSRRPCTGSDGRPARRVERSGSSGGGGASISRTSFTPTM